MKDIFLGQVLLRHNPVLYVFMGIRDEIKSGLEAELACRDGYAYLDLCVRYNSVLQELKKIHQYFIRQQYKTVGILRINYLFNILPNFDDLFEIMAQIESIMTKLYPGGIITDLYAFFDEQSEYIVESSLNTVFHGLLDLSKKVNMSYIFSSINSHGTIREENIENTVQSIAKISLIKDCASYINENARTMYTQYLYDEGYFCNDAKEKAGDFYTIGHFRLSILVDEILEIMTLKLVSALFEECPDDSELIRQVFSTVKFNRSNEQVFTQPDFLRGILIQKDFKALPDYATNEQAIHIIFGSRLTKYFDLNYCVENHTEFSIDALREYDIVRVYNALKPSGAIDQYLHNILALDQEKVSDAQSDIDSWMAAQLGKKSKDFYISLSKTYIDKRLALETAISKKNETENMKKAFDAYLQNIEPQVKNLIDYCKELDHEITKRLKRKNKVFTFYLKDYYETMAAKRHFDFSSCRSSDPNQYYSNFKKIVKDTFLDEIQKLRVDDEIIARFTAKTELSEEESLKLIFDSIVSEKIYNVSLKTDDKNKYSEITLILDYESRFVNYFFAHRDLFFMYNINLHFVQGKKDIDVIYHMGTFKISELFYADLYSVGGL